MKKLFIGIFLFCVASVAHAQENVEVYINGTQMKNGDTIVITTPTSDEMLHAFAVFKNVSGKDLTLSAQKTKFLPEGVTDGWCIFGNCVTGDKIDASRVLEDGKYFGSATDYIDINPNGYIGKDAVITYMISSKEEPKDVLEFTVVWDFGAKVEKPLEITVEGQPVGDNQEIELDFETIESGFLIAPLSFTNPGKDSLQIKGIKGAFLAEGTHDDWCLLGNCWIGNEFEASYDIAPGQTIVNSELDGQYFDYTPNGYIGRESVTYYTISTVEQPYNSVSFAIRWKTSGTRNEIGQNKIKTSAYPNPANDNISISWEQTDKNTKLNIRSVSGQLVKTLNTSGLTQTNLNVRDWTPGMYFYSIEANGTRLGGGKIVVK